MITLYGGRDLSLRDMCKVKYAVTQHSAAQCSVGIYSYHRPERTNDKGEEEEGGKEILPLAH